MAMFTCDAEGGTNGADVSTSDTGSGTSFNSTTGATGGMTYSTTEKAHGSKSLKLTNTGADAYASWTLGGTKQAALRAYFRVSAQGAGDVRILSVSSATTQYLNLTLKGTTNLLTLSNNAGTVLWTSTGTWALDTWYRAEGSLDTTAGGTAAIIVFKTFLGDSTTEIANMSWSASGQTTGNAALAQADVGRRGTGITGFTVYLDDIAVQDGTTALFGPVAALTATTTVKSVAAATGWTPSAATVLSCLSDDDPATYVTSSNDPTALKLDVTLGGVTAPAAGQSFDVTLSALVRVGGASGTVDVSLYDGASLVKKKTGVAVTTSSSDAVVSFASADWAAMTPTTWATGVRLLIEATSA